jgi:hypothetical protein
MVAFATNKKICPCTGGTGLTVDDLIQCRSGDDCTSCTSGYTRSGSVCNENQNDVIDEEEEDVDATESGSKSVCFSNSAMFTLEGGELLRGDELQVGHVIAVGGGRHEEIIEFAHREISRFEQDFIELVLDNGESVRATPNHKTAALWREGAAMNHVDFGAVLVGDLLPAAEGGERVAVVAVNLVKDSGSINPVVAGGEVMVGGVVLSTMATEWVRISNLAVDIFPKDAVAWFARTFMH